MIRKIKLLIPPIFFILYKKTFPKKPVLGNWTGDYKTWEEAKQNCAGYDTDIILEKCKTALLKVKNGDAVYERDSVLFDKIQYSWGLLAGLQKAAIENNNKLCVLDFGGSLGSTYYQNKDFLNNVNINWCIVEQENFIKCGKQNFENNELKFYYNIDECLKSNTPNVIILSSVLQYLENPYFWTDIINDLKINYIIIDRTAFIESDNDVLTIQTVPEKIYKASYPSWFLNKEKLLNSFNNYTIVSEIESSFTENTIINDKKAQWTGMILKLKI